jgi:plasmid stability protein
VKPNYERRSPYAGTPSGTSALHPLFYADGRAWIDPKTPWVHNRPVADVKVRKVPDWVIESFRCRAVARGHSLEEELRSLLTEVAHARRQEFIAETDAFQENLRARYGQLSDSTRSIMEDRERRG